MKIREAMRPGPWMTSQARKRIVHQAPFHDAGHGFDEFGLYPPYLATVITAARPLYERYFRVDSLGIENIPADGPVILVGNHGGVLPVDGALLCLDVLFNTDPPRIPRAVADRFVPRLPLISTIFARLGVVSGTRPNVRRLLERGELLALWPEGVSGPAKPFRERYQIQRWSVGFAELAIRYRAQVVPVAIIGPEESWPLLARVRAFHGFGVPYLPIPLSPLPLPTRCRIRYGTPMTLGRVSADGDDPELVKAAAHDVRRALEQLIADARHARRGVFR